MSISRREFLKETAAVAGGLAVAPLLTEESEAEAPPRGLPMRLLGRTKERTSLLGFGTATLGSDNTTPEEAERVLNFALEQGITYFDTAPVYGDPKSKYGNAEMKMKGFLKAHRKSLFLVTKANSGRQDRDGMVQQIEESLERMGVGQVDALHIHNLGDFDMERMFAPDGALAGLKEARRRGLTRYLAVSGHMRPARFVRLLETGDIDLTMIALNFADRANYDFEGLVLPVAQKQGTAVVAMKVLGGAKEWQYDGKTPGTLADYHERAIRYSLGLPGVCCAVLGFANEEEVRQAVAVARAYKPLSAEEKAALLAEGQKLAKARGKYYGEVEG